MAKRAKHAQATRPTPRDNPTDATDHAPRPPGTQNDMSVFYSVIRVNPADAVDLSPRMLPLSSGARRQRIAYVPGPSGATLLMRARSGKRRIHTATTTSAPRPPSTTDTTLPKAAATTPARNSPSVPEVPVHIEFTAITRPSMSC